MNTPRETVYAALFAKLFSMQSAVDPLPAGTFKMVSRRWQTFDDVPSESMPCLFLNQVGEDPAQSRGLPGKWTLHTHLWIYINSEAQTDQTVIPSQILNPLIDAIENVALAPDDHSKMVCTLGGLVSHCWIEGAVETSEGVLGDTEIARIPVGILVPN